MNLIILFEQDFTDKNSVTLRDDRFLQIRNIHQSVVGDTVRLGKLNGLIGTGIVNAINDQQVDISVTLTQQPPQKLPLTLILALPRPKMIRRIFRSISELGIKQLIIINSYKVEKSFWHSPALSPEKIEAYLIAGLQQAKDTALPTVTFERLFKPFVEDKLGEIIEGKRALIAHPESQLACPHHLSDESVIAIGPEGGFTSYEVTKFKEVGFESIHLGPRIMRVENAITALTSKLYPF